jgi:hypothetical protein
MIADDRLVAARRHQTDPCMDGGGCCRHDERLRQISPRYGLGISLHHAVFRDHFLHPSLPVQHRYFLPGNCNTWFIIRNGTAMVQEGIKPTHAWMVAGAADMMKDFAKYLPLIPPRSLKGFVASSCVIARMCSGASARKGSRSWTEYRRRYNQHPPPYALIPMFVAQLN